MTSRHGQAEPADRVGFHDRLLAEAVRTLEHDGAAAIDDPDVLQRVRSAGGDVEQRIVNRARMLPHATALQQALHRINSVMSWIIALGALLALLAGAATARATLGVDGQAVVNFYWVLAGILGVQLIALALWAALLVASMAARSASHEPAMAVSLGSLVLGAAQWLARKVQPSSEQAAAVAAAGRVHAGGAIGRWTFSSITHGMWLAFNVGCLLMIIALLSARQYTFVWETTILTERLYLQMTRGLAWLPETVGFAVPSDEQVAASQRIDQVPAQTNAREAWSSLLVGCIVVYGLGPRLLLLGLSLSLRRTATQRMRLDTTLPGYARLEQTLADQPPHLREADEDAWQPMPAADNNQPQAHARPIGGPMIVGIDMARPASWPPRVPGVQWGDLGVLENRDDQRAAVDRLASSPQEPSSLLIVCDLATTPDRGIARVIRQLRRPLTRPLAMLLTGGSTLRGRGMNADHIAQRVQHWREMAASVGLESDRIIEVDLDHLTEASAQRLAELLGHGDDREHAPGRRIEQAFDVILDHVQRSQQAGGTVSDAAQAEMHRAIARVYQTDDSWRSMLHVPTTLTGDIAGTLKSSADRMVHLLPARLRSSPRWLAAGAVSGALGCVAAATLLSPVAIAALPTWSMIGSAVAGIMQMYTHRPPEQPETAPQPDCGEAVRAAALFAMLLELQGRNEADITRILDRAIAADEENERITDADAARAWLDRLRHRLDLAMSEVAS